MEMSEKLAKRKQQEGRSSIQPSAKQDTILAKSHCLVRANLPNECWTKASKECAGSFCFHEMTIHVKQTRVSTGWGTLVSRFEYIGWNGHNPISHAGHTTRRQDGNGRQLCRILVSLQFGHFHFDKFVCSKPSDGTFGRYKTREGRVERPHPTTTHSYIGQRTIVTHQAHNPLPLAVTCRYQNCPPKASNSQHFYKVSSNECGDVFSRAERGISRFSVRFSAFSSFS